MAQILVIDDDEMNRELLRDILHAVGYQVIEASDGEEGLRLFCQESTDLVITDIRMPRKSGFEVIEELRQNCPGTKIIAITASGHELLAMAKALGANRTVEKPFRMREMQDTVRGLLEEDG